MNLALITRIHRSPLRVLNVKAVNTNRPDAVRPMPRKRVSRTEWAKSGNAQTSPWKTRSISRIDTP